MKNNPDEIRGCCPNCGSSQIKNYGWFTIEAEAKAEIFLIGSDITTRISEVHIGDTLKEKQYSDFYKPSYFNTETFGFECEECRHSFKAEDAKAAIKGPSLAKLAEGMLQ